MDKIDSNHMHLTSFFGPDPSEYPLPPAHPQRVGGSRCQLYKYWWTFKGCIPQIERRMGLQGTDWEVPNSKKKGRSR